MPAERALAPALRLGDPLRRLFLDELRTRTSVPRPLADEWALARADLTLAVVDDEEPTLVITAGDLDGRRRWTIRQPLGGLDTGDLVSRRHAELIDRGEAVFDAALTAEQEVTEFLVAMAATLDEVARLRPEQASVPRRLAAVIRAGCDRAPGALDGDNQALDGDDKLDNGDFHDDEFDDLGELDDKEEDQEEDQEEARPVHRHLHAVPPPRRPRRGGVARVARAFVATVLVAGGAGVVVFALILGADADRNNSTAGDTTAPTAAAGAVPDYSIQLRNADGSPVRLDPCRGYAYVVQPGSVAPETAAAEVGGAFAALEEATGIAFRFAGYSDARFPHPLDPEQLPRLPILVSYEAPETSLALTENTSDHPGVGVGPLGGLAVGTPVEARAGLTVVAGGAMILDETLASEQRARILLHELGHLVGLGHASDPDQMMAAAVPESGPATYREGDRTGLAELGADSGCALTDAERASVYGADEPR